MKNVLLAAMLLAFASCSSLPSPETASVPPSGAPETLAGQTEPDQPEINKRAEEELPYLDTAIESPLPEPQFLLPEAAELGGTERPEPNTVNPDVVLFEPNPDEAALAALTEEKEAETAPEPPPPPPVTTPEVPPVPVTAAPPVEAAPSKKAAPPPSPPAAVKAPEKRAAQALQPVAVTTPPAPLPPRPERAVRQEPVIRQPEHVQTAASTVAAAAPLRSITVTLGETAEVPFTGTGWVYLGEAGEQKGLSYLRRRASDDGQVFLFKPEAVGVYRLNFNRQDLLRGTSRDEAVELAVVEKSQVSQKAAAPEEGITIIAPKLPAIPGHAIEGGIEAGTEHDASGTKDAFNETGEPLAAAESADAALWNRGQALEAPGQTRDMKAALLLYRDLIRDYPESEHYTDSQKRIAYIERFFVNIR